MPNKLQAWDVMNGMGQPTRSIYVNHLIKVFQRREVRQEGKCASADRAFEQDEFKQIIDMLASKKEIKYRFVYSKIYKFQFHLITRIDDTVHLLKSSLTRNPD